MSNTFWWWSVKTEIYKCFYAIKSDWSHSMVLLIFLRSINNYISNTTWRSNIIFCGYCHVWIVCVFWIGWLDLLTPSLQFKPIITAHSQWLSKTRSIHYWSTSVFSSTVTNNKWRLSPEWILLHVLACSPFVTAGEPNRDHYFEQFFLSVCLSGAVLSP
jgi:hypothetical protein